MKIAKDTKTKSTKNENKLRMKKKNLKELLRTKTAEIVNFIYFFCLEHQQKIASANVIEMRWNIHIHNYGNFHWNSLLKVLFLCKFKIMFILSWKNLFFPPFYELYECRLLSSSASFYDAVPAFFSYGDDVFACHCFIAFHCVNRIIENKRWNLNEFSYIVADFLLYICSDT